MANPVFRNNRAFGAYGGVTQAPPDPGTLQSHYDAPSAAGFDAPAEMTYDGTLAKSAAFFLLAATSAVIVGLFVPGIAIVLSIAAFVMSLVVAFRKGAPSPVLYGITIALFGGAAGGLSAFYEAFYDGIILHALIATATVFAVSLAVFKSGRVRNMAKIRKFLMIAVPAYVVFSLVDFGMVLLGADSVRDVSVGGFPLGIVFSAFAILVGAFMLISDFDFVENGVRNRISAAYEWTAAYGLVFAIIWIYLEMLRLLSYLRGR